jgi:hypothetical protein
MGGCFAVSTDNRWDAVCSAAGVDAGADVRPYYERNLLAFEFRHHTRQPHKAVSQKRPKQEAAANAPPLLTAMEKCEIEGAISLGFLGNALTPSEARFFDAIADDTSSPAGKWPPADVQSFIRMQRAGPSEGSLGGGASDAHSFLAWNLLSAHRLKQARKSARATGAANTPLSNTASLQGLLTTYVMVRDALIYRWTRGGGQYLSPKHSRKGVCVCCRNPFDTGCFYP